MKAILISTDGNHNEYRIKNNAYGGVTYYRLVAPMKAVNNLGHNWELFKPQLLDKDKPNYNKLFSEYDIVISKHIDNPAAAKAVQLACQKNKIPLVYDMDDDMFAIRKDNPAYSSYGEGEMKRVYLATNLSFADAFFVSTQPLKDSYSKFFKQMFNLDIPIYVLPNFNDVELFNFPSKTNKNKIIIGYHGSISHDADLKMVLPTIDKLMSKYKNLYMQLLGSVRRDSIQDLFKNIRNKDRFEVLAGTPAFDKFPEKLMSMNWDIGIAPLIDDAFNRSKSHIKYMEYSMKKIPTIASDVYPYTHNASEAFLCKDLSDWYSTLDKLIKEPNTRKKTGQKAYESVLNNQQYKDHSNLWIDAATTVIKNYKK